MTAEDADSFPDRSPVLLQLLLSLAKTRTQVRQF